MRLEVALLAGEETKQFLANLTRQVDRLEALGGGKLKGKPKTEDDEDEETTETEDEEDEDFAAKKSKKKAKTDEDEETEESEDADEEETADADEDEDEAPAKKKGKAKLTIDDVNDACKAYAKATSRADALKVLKKKFKTDSIADLKPEQYADCIKAMTVEE